MRGLFSSVLVLLFFAIPASRAQENDYLKHGKIFCLCSFKRDCSNCYECNKDRLLVKVHNKTDKKIKRISYKFYSSVYNRVLEKDAKIEGNLIDKRNIGRLYVCVPDGNHWAISEIEYTDDSKETFVVKGRLEDFLQEPDECECNE